MRGISGLPRFRRDRAEFRDHDDGHIAWGSDFPVLGEWGEASGGLGAYFQQDLTVARWIFEANPRRHVDVGSRIDGFVGHLAVFREVEVLDIRPAPGDVRGIRFHQLDLMDPLPECWRGATDSLSCLHTIEHFGLGRYGDPIDPYGYRKGLDQLFRIVAPGGRLYLSVPMGRERIEFNAHRVFSPERLLGWFGEGFELERAAVIDDEERVVEETRSGCAELIRGATCETGVGIVAVRKVR